ncbi:MAG: type II toxin-antitoxin system Phd/YefM family antitoxin [Olsenella sp.]|nr:type II toxin-antitoxin system Phd/YefM family antitoxin [Olsenella sp.]
MPIIKSSSELQRNFGALNQLAHETREPIYITRNGDANLVLMDAEAFEATLTLQRQVIEHEMRIYEAVEQSERDFDEGRGMSLDDIRRRRFAASQDGAGA